MGSFNRSARSFVYFMLFGISSLRELKKNRESSYNFPAFPIFKPIFDFVVLQISIIYINFYINLKFKWCKEFKEPEFQISYARVSGFGYLDFHFGIRVPEFQVSDTRISGFGYSNFRFRVTDFVGYPSFVSLVYRNPKWNNISTSYLPHACISVRVIWEDYHKILQMFGDCKCLWKRTFTMDRFWSRYWFHSYSSPRF